jgi:hypothetical protein
VTDLTEFIWVVPTSGYRWIDSEVHKRSLKRATFMDAGNPRLKPQPVLTDSLSSGLPASYRTYRPLEEHTGLYHEFIETDWHSRESILQFANQYGLLGDQWLPAEPSKGNESLARTFVETLRDWQNHIFYLGLAVSLWGLVRDKDAAGLSRFLREMEPGRWLYSFEQDGIPGGGQIEPVEHLFVPGNILIPASFLVQRWVNEALADVRPQVLYDVERERRVFRMMPQTLIGAMWLQFAQTIDGNRTHRQCKECNAWFEISTADTGKRINREFCADKCKSRNYQRRKSEARQLKAEGKTVTAIAKKLDTDPATIKAWTSKRKG